MTTRTMVLATLGAVLAPCAVANAQIKYEIDKEHSSIIFKVKNRDITYIYGRFNDVSGTIEVNSLARPTRLTIKAQVKSKSIDTNSRKRDKHLKTPEFFGTSKNPVISFETKSSKRIERDSKRFELTGELKMLGVTKELTVVFEVTGKKLLTADQYRLGGQTSFTINRSDFGMDAMIPGIADEVTVIVTLEGQAKIIPSG